MNNISKKKSSFKRYISMISVLVLATVLSLFLIIFAYNKANAPNLSEVELMRQKFNCDRVSEDFRTTDLYCNYPSLYFEDLKNNNVIDKDDFDSPKYKNLLRRHEYLNSFRL